MDRIKILFIAADPSDSARLRLGQELRDIREKLQLAKQRDSFLLESRESVRPGDITQAIFDVEPEIVHFSGHGISTGELCFENILGKMQPVQPDALANLFLLVKEQVKCVIINACYSEAQAKAIAKHIPFVIGMNQSIGDKTAISFAVGFYKALGAGRSFEKAYKFACVEIQLSGISEHLTPVLYRKKDTTSISSDSSLTQDREKFKIPNKQGDVRITMLGVEGSGKTSYLLGLYSLMQLGINGFTLTAKEPDIDLEMTDEWENLVDLQGSDRWPPIDTKGIKQYIFDFCYGLQPLLEFEFLDYSGGAMASLPIDNSSSCLLLFISGDLLSEELENDSQSHIIARQAGTHIMNRHLLNIKKAKNTTNNDPFPIVIVISKFDMCYQRGKAELIEKIKQIFQPLFIPNSGWLVMICPISLGKELADDRNLGTIAPKNLHLPFVFALYSKFREYASYETDKVNDFREVLHNLKSSWLTKMLRSEQLQSVEISLSVSEQRINEIQQKMKLLSEELSNAELYFSGKEVEIDV